MEIIRLRKLSIEDWQIQDTMSPIQSGTMPA